MNREPSILDQDELPDGWYREVKRNALKGHTKMGVPYMLFVGNAMVNIFIVTGDLGYGQIGIPLFCLVHFSARAWGERDPQWWEVAVQNFMTHGLRFQKEGALKAPVKLFRFLLNRR